MALTSAGAVKFNVRGDGALRAKIMTMRALFPEFVDRALKEEAQDILNDAQENYVPVETEELKDSGRVENILRGTGREVAIRFGGTPETEPYAIAVHEHLSAASPPSWKGKTIRWSKPGTGPKYLEIPFNKAISNGYLARMADRLVKFIASA